MATYTSISAFTSGQTLASTTMNAVKNNLDLTTAQSQYRFRNLLHNGAMSVAQRGAAGTTGVTTTSFPCVDRWAVVLTSAGTYTITQATDAPAASGLSVSSKVACTTANVSPGATSAATYTQNLEGQDVQHLLKGTASALQATLTFWVKSTTTGTYIAELNDATNTRFVSASYTINSANTWEQKSVTFPADTSGAIANSASAGLTVNFWLVAGSNYTSGTLSTTWGTTAANRAVGQTNLAALNTNTWQVTGVQLELGAVSTPFEVVPYGEELKRCQRYYFRSTANAQFAAFGSGLASATSTANVFVKYPTTMRSINPTFAQSNCLLYYNAATVGISSILAQYASADSALVQISTAAVFTTGQAILLVGNATGSYIEASAEI